jgi:hypothetical protein
LALLVVLLLALLLALPVALLMALPVALLVGVKRFSPFSRNTVSTQAVIITIITNNNQIINSIFVSNPKQNKLPVCNQSFVFVA